jgi:PleD family two-component response regulator
VATSSVTVTDRNLRVTVSIGATLMRVDDSPATLIARADRLMYESKQGGRNRVTCEA